MRARRRISGKKARGRFSEEKLRKRLSLAFTRALSTSPGAKVFCFFFSKKKFFLPIAILLTCLHVVRMSLSISHVRHDPNPQRAR
jgi:hypothetical protein